MMAEQYNEQKYFISLLTRDEKKLDTLMIYLDQ